MVPRSDWLRTAIPENARRRLKERYLSKDRLNRISSPQTAPITEQTLYFVGTESQRAVRDPDETVEILAVPDISGKKAAVGIRAIGFRNRLLRTRLSVLAEACQVLFLFAISLFDLASG